MNLLLYGSVISLRLCQLVLPDEVAVCSIVDIGARYLSGMLSVFYDWESRKVVRA